MIAEDVSIEVRLPINRPISWEDLQAIPDDQHWGYQIFDGTLLVAPSPGGAHQSCENGEYVEIAIAKGDEPLTVAEPFPVTVVPSTLLTE